MAIFIVPMQGVSRDKGIQSRIGVRVSDIRHCDKNFERVLFVWFAYASFDFTFDFCLSLLTVTVMEKKILYQLGKARGE